MIVVLTLSCCPPRLRGDISKWLMEIDANVFVGRVSVRVKDELWGRIVRNIGDGRATLVFTVRNEQGLDFHTHNCLWEPRDFDGITLMFRPECGIVKDS